MADDAERRAVTTQEALQFLYSITGQNFSSLQDPAISSALRAANVASGGTGGSETGSCVYEADGVMVCHDGSTQEQCESAPLNGIWSLRSCAMRPGEWGENRLTPIDYASADPTDTEAVPPTTPTRRAAKPAKKKPAKKRAAPRAAKRATAAARTKPKKKAAGKAKPKRRAVKAAAKKTPKRTAKKAKRRR